jgi:hypothetical protein
MRALIGAIIAAGALIGLGLNNLAIGQRYALANLKKPDGTLYDVKFHEIDNPLQFGMVFLITMGVIGLGIAFVGLMYHHERRFREAQLGVGSETRAVP